MSNSQNHEHLKYFPCLDAEWYTGSHFWWIISNQQRNNIYKTLQQKYSLWLLLDYLKGHLNLQNTLQRHPCLPAEIYVDSVGKSEAYIILQEKKTKNLAHKNYDWLNMHLNLAKSIFIDSVRPSELPIFN